MARTRAIALAIAAAVIGKFCALPGREASYRGRLGRTRCPGAVSHGPRQPTTARESFMPLINVKLLEDVFTPEQKGEMVE